LMIYSCLKKGLTAIYMAKEHQTFPGEGQEMPQPDTGPEIKQPGDPGQPEIPQEDNQVVPDEFPPEENSPESPVIPPAP
jgi:hypothetical protein